LGGKPHCQKELPVESGSLTEAYEQILADYVESRSEEALYRASLLSQQFIEEGLGPEDIIALHFEAGERYFAKLGVRERTRAMSDAHQLLLEVMIAYGVKYREYLEYRLQETIRDAETRIAVAHEQALEQERLEQEKAQILTMIAHELRNPITAAITNLDLAERSISRGQVERVTPLLNSARDALGRLSRLSANLVEASRDHQPDLALSPQDLHKLLADTYGWARPSARAKEVRLTLEEGGAHPVVLGNSDALLSILGNLLSNAIRYTNAGGHIVARTGVVDGRGMVEISDTGIGMSESVRARIFERFYRAPDGRNMEPQGLGLGLALVKQMLDAQQGEIEVESEAGVGSTFRVLLPLASSDKENGTHG
jgi:signal transduction histidine kinase